MKAAVAGHSRHQAAWYRALCGPLVCAETRLAELRTVLTATGTPSIELVLVVTGGRGQREPGARRGRRRSSAAAARGRGAGQQGYGAARGGHRGRQGARRCAARRRYRLHRVPRCEPSPTRPRLARCWPSLAIAATGVKLRTGGVSAEAFPGEGTLAGCLAGIADSRVQFKCTAGLHHAVRHTATDTGFEHHGFLNVLLATWAAAQGAPAAELTSLLAERDPQAVAARVSLLDEHAADDVRGLFNSFGTCSIDDPVGDLVALGLLTKPDSAKMQ